MKLINLEKAIEYAKEKDYIKTSNQERALREVFALATVEAVPIDAIDKIRSEIADLDDAEYEFEGYYKAVTDALQIDKYKVESEVQK